MIILREESFSARERKQRRKIERKAQNAEMHANRAANKAKEAEKLAKEAMTTEELNAAKKTLQIADRASVASAREAGNMSLVHKAIDKKNINPDKMEKAFEGAEKRAAFNDAAKKSWKLGKKGVDIAKKNPVATGAVVLGTAAGIGYAAKKKKDKAA